MRGCSWLKRRTHRHVQQSSSELHRLVPSDYTDNNDGPGSREVRHGTLCAGGGYAPHCQSAIRGPDSRCARLVWEEVKGMA